jgi:hypothetical protein
MTLKNLSLCMLLSAIASCNGGVGNKDQPPASGTDSASAQPGAAVNACDTTSMGGSIYSIRNDQVIKEALEKILTCRLLDSVFRDVKKESKTSPNKYESESFDTTVLYHIDCDSIIYLSSKTNCFPLHLNIQSQRLSIDSGYVKVGMTKEKFMERFREKKDVPDIIRLSELEGSNELIFFFSKGLLSKIIYNNLYVD